MAIIFLENVSWFWFIYDEFNLKTTNSERLMIFIWNIFLSQSTFNTKNHLFLSTKVVRSFYLLNCTSACNFNSFETTKTLFFPYAICYFCREIFFHKLRFLLTLFFLTKFWDTFSISLLHFVKYLNGIIFEIFLRIKIFLRYVSISLLYPFHNRWSNI